MTKKRIKLDTIPAVGNTFTNWIRILAGNRFKIGFKFIPKAILTTIITISFAPFNIIEKIIYNRRIKEIDVKSPIFIVGHMRSGTTFLHYMFAQDENLTTITQTETIFPSIFLTLNRIIRCIMRHSLPEKRPMDNMKFQENWPAEDEFAMANLCPYSPYNGGVFPKKLEYYYKRYVLFKGTKEKIIKKWKDTYRFLIQKISYKGGYKRVLSKSLVNAGRMDKILEIFPDAKFVHIYRNPYEVFLSTKKLYNRMILKSFAFQSISQEELEKVLFTIMRTGFTKFLELKKTMPKNTLIEIRFEDFVKEPIKHMEKIYNQLEIPDFDKAKSRFERMAKNYSTYQKDKYSIPEAIEERIYKEEEFLFKEYGYSRDY